MTFALGFLPGFGVLESPTLYYIRSACRLRSAIST